MHQPGSEGRLHCQNVHPFTLLFVIPNAAAEGLVCRTPFMIIAPFLTSASYVLPLCVALSRNNLRLHQPEVVHDLPAGGRRFVQRADGYRATLVAGMPVFENGEETGARPGRLVRAGR
jgi:hypothetical protein